MSDRTVYVVHAIDTEGPLAESELSMNGHRPKPDYETQDDNFDFSEGRLKELIERHRAATLGSWEEIIAMLRRATSERQRMRMTDSFGGGWIYNWFCMDHVGFVENPRRRAMGLHQIFDFYTQLVSEQESGDAVHWHFHPSHRYGVGNKCATSYLNSPELYEILGRRLIERRWFPSASRAGFYDERPDSHWFLEQWIPFDFSNTVSDDRDYERNPDQLDGRLSDWRWAPSDWRTYHPHHDCHQLEGGCRRKIARSLLVLNRHSNLDEAETLKAFDRADQGLPTLLGVTTHDWRDLTIEVEYVRRLLRKSASKYPNVKFKYAEAVEAFNAVHPPREDEPSLKMECTLVGDEAGRPLRVNVAVGRGKVFGPQPFLAIQTRSRQIVHDNMNFWRSIDDFNYQFDDHSILPDDVKAIGVAANDEAGRQSIHVLDLDSASFNRNKQLVF
jgi:hypothetical protein